jgi:4-amino-4-deoxy-L-arabinose transferase-like glycosyltransferase
MPERHERRIGLVILILYVGLSLALIFTARPQSDEASYANPGFNLLYHGRMSMTVFELRGYLPLSSAQRCYWQPPLFFLLTATWFRIFGAGLLQLRLLSLLFGLLTLVCWYAVVRRIQRSVQVALLAAAFISVDYFFLIGSSQGRMEMVCAGFGAAGLAAYVSLREKFPTRAVFCGHALAALSVMTHPVGIVYWGGLVFAMWWLDRARFSIRTLAIGAIPYLIAFAAWGVYIFQDLPAFREQSAGMLALVKGTFYDPNLSRIGFVQLFEQEVIDRYASPYGLLRGASAAGRLKILVLAAYLAGVFGILLTPRLRRDRSAVLFSALFLVAFFLMAEVSPSKFNYYLPHTTPMMAVCLAVFLWNTARSRRWLIGLVFLVVAGVQLGGVMNVIRHNEYRGSYRPAIQAIERNSGPDALVMGSNELWFGLWSDRNLLGDPELGYLSGLRPAVFVVDPLYRMLHEQDQRSHPLVYEHFQRLLDRSRQVYQDGYYSVFALPPPGSD